MISSSECKLAVRQVLRQPLLAITIVLALGVGIGVATAGFTFMNAIVNGQLPFDRADSFVRLTASVEPDGSRTAIVQDLFSALRDGATSFDYLGVIAGGHLNILHSTDEVETVIGASLTPGWFRHLPYQPLDGRLLSVDDGQVGAEPVTLISENLWKRRYGGAAHVVSGTINVAGVDRTVVGVVPEGMDFPNSPDVWIPLPERRPLDPVVGGELGAGVFGVLPE